MINSIGNNKFAEFIPGPGLICRRSGLILDEYDRNLLLLPSPQRHYYGSVLSNQKSYVIP